MSFVIAGSYGAAVMYFHPGNPGLVPSETQFAYYPYPYSRRDGQAELTCVAGYVPR